MYEHNFKNVQYESDRVHCVSVSGWGGVWGIDEMLGRVCTVTGHVSCRVRQKKATDFNGIWFLFMILFICPGLWASSGSIHLPG